jgi:hypothetical protein
MIILRFDFLLGHHLLSSDNSDVAIQILDAESGEGESNIPGEEGEDIEEEFIEEEEGSLFRRSLNMMQALNDELGSPIRKILVRSSRPGVDKEDTLRPR